MRPPRNKLVIPPASEVIPDEMLANANGDDVQVPALVPHMFTQPAPMPVGVVVELFTDDQEQQWIALRTETIYGSHVVFLTAEVAANVAEQIDEIVEQ